MSHPDELLGEMEDVITYSPRIAPIIRSYQANFHAEPHLTLSVLLRYCLFMVEGALYYATTSTILLSMITHKYACVFMGM